MSDIKLKKVVSKALDESVLRYGMTLHATCPKYRKSRINKIIQRTVNNIAYGMVYEHLEHAEKTKELKINLLNSFFRLVVLTKHCFYKCFKTPVNKPIRLRCMDMCVIPRIYTGFGKMTRL